MENERKITDSAEENPAEDTAPYAPDATEKGFANQDNRKITNPRYYPYSTIAYMKIVGECGCSWTGTGFMVGKDMLLTAAHCLICTEHGQWAQKIGFYFGYRNDKNYLCKYNGAWRARVGTLFNGSYSIDRDYGCVRLKKNVGEKVGWLGYMYASDDTITAERINVAWYANGRMRAEMCNAEQCVNGLITYSETLLSASGGGPIFTSSGYAVGIDVSRDGDSNTGIRITRSLMKDFDGL